MTKRMLIDATHAEETRVVVLDGNRIEDFDVETSAKKQLKGNIYLAKVVRVEPSLQAAFVEYGGGRHGFLAFGEIHPDYYQIPVADRQRLLAMQAEEARAEAEDEDNEVLASSPRPPAAPIETREADNFEPAMQDDPADEPADYGAAPDIATSAGEADPAVNSAIGDAADPDDAEGPDDSGDRSGSAQPMTMARDERFGPADAEVAETPIESLDLDPAETTTEEPPEPIAPSADGEADTEADEEDLADLDTPEEVAPPPETIGGESEQSGSDDARRRRESRFLRNYRIQEVIRRRQIMLIQVVKEERGTKGAALTTYISLAGRFSVLMPNSPRGGGISRKITSAADRRRLKEVTAELDLPQGMGLIVRTAGANRPKPEIKRDCEYLMRLWDDIRELTLRSVAPALIYEEASLIKRAIRDGYSRDIDEVIVDGEPGWRAAHEFMRMLMPSHAKKVQLWRGEGGQPLFAKHQVEAQLDAMLSPTVQLKSGGYLVINQTEALVAIDVNSGRSTRERGIEETAYRTNLEAADEAARQLRLRDLAGLIVIDFIDMESRKNNVAVERRLKDALHADRARIQVGTISHFGLMEMSRQRLRPSVTETSFIACPHCGGSGHVRSTESAAIHVLRAIEDEGARGRSAVIMVHAASSLVMYLLNHKRDRLAEIEIRCGMRVQFAMDETLMPPAHRIEKVRARTPEDRPIPPLPVAPAMPPSEAADEVEEAPDVEEDDEPESEATEAATGTRPETAEEGERRRKRRRRRRGGRRDTEAGTDASPETVAQRIDESGDEATDAPPEMLAVDQAAARPSEGLATQDVLADAPQADGPSADGPSADGPSADARAEPVVADTDLVATRSAEAPVDEEASDAEGASGRRRGRRGGRRRRRDDAEPAAAEAASAEPASPPAYTGPTPADPFGGTGFDIYDLLDTAPADRRPPEFPAADEPKADLALAEDAETANDTVSQAPVAVTSPQAMPVEAIAPTPPAAEASVPEAPTPETEPSGPMIGAPVQPVVIDGDVSTAAPKRGWWRR